MNPSTALAAVLVDELVRGGVRDVVMAPGSRSAPLALALHAADAAGRLRLHVRIDERSAGFVALGLAKAGGRPVAVATTSGTAVANLHPAVLEAHHTGAPLLVLSADRPPELRGTGANQTIDQLKLFGDAVRLFHEVGVPEERPGQVVYWRALVCRALAAAAGAMSRDPGPVHLNLAFREPLLPDGSPGWVEPLEGRAEGQPWTSARAPDEAGEPLAAGPRTVVLAGDGAGRPARQLAERGGWPLLAEPTSGARSGPHAIGTYRLLLDAPAGAGAAGRGDGLGGLAAGIERVVVFGHPTLSRPVTRLLSRDDVEIVVVASTARWPDVGRSAARVAVAVAPDRAEETVGPAEPDEWLRRWQASDRVARRAVDSLLASGPLSGPAVAGAVASALVPGALLVVGSSNPIRDLDLAAPWDDGLPESSRRPARDEHSVVLGNRGVAGIDGTVSTAVGAALAHQAGGRGRPAYALMGDLTFLHDANGLIIGPAEPRPDLCIVVVNDNGGGIFSLLEQGEPEYADAFERVFGTPHGVDLAALCAATGTPYERVPDRTRLIAALAPRPGIRVVEVAIGRTTRRDLHARLRTAVTQALAAPMITDP